MTFDVDRCGSRKIMTVAVGAEADDADMTEAAGKMTTMLKLVTAGKMTTMLKLVIAGKLNGRQSYR